MKSDRLLSALMLLQGYGRLSTREIAERLEISQRTAHRDMEALCTAGVPLIAHRGAQGGWELEKGWRTQVPALDAAELKGLMLSQQPGVLGGSRLAAAAQRAYDKLMAALPAAAKREADSIRARLHFDPLGWRREEEDISMLPVVQDALAQDRKLTFIYTRPDGETSTRTADPLGIVCKQAVWYLVARTPKGMRTFRLSRMREVMVLAIEFERPAGFDLADYWKTSTAELKEQQGHFWATIALSPRAATSLRRWSTMIADPDHPATGSLPEGWQIWKADLETLSDARFAVMGLAASAVALGPEELVAAIDTELARMADVRQTMAIQVHSQGLFILHRATRSTAANPQVGARGDDK